jgi:SAM-dependent methyltransferase
MHIRTLADYRRSLASNLVSRFRKQQPRILDVGCGSGEFIHILNNAGATSVGLEPSRPLLQRARKDGLEVVPGVVGPDTKAALGPIDGWTCLQVLEHIADPVAFVTHLGDMLPVGGVGVIEVPSVEHIIRHARFYDFFTDHLNYFSEDTLALCCRLAGLHCTEITRGLDDQFLVAFVTPVPSHEWQSLQSRADTVIGELREWARAKLARGKKVAVWGAGYKSIAAICAADLTGLSYVIDSDPAKHGKYTPGSRLLIRPPSAVRDDPVDAIILAAVAYKREILGQMRTTLGFTGEVVAMESSLELL